MAESKQYDVVIIGAGPGGMTAAMYASRANLSVLMLDRGIYGGNLNNTAEIENYTGFKSVKGPELAQQMYECCGLSTSRRTKECNKISILNCY